MKRLSQAELSALLYQVCALRLRPRGRSSAIKQDVYLAWFPRGLLKIGISASPEVRMTSIPSDARARGIIPSTNERAELRAIVPCGGRRLEKALLQALWCERIGGEYFSGPLSARINAALEAA